MAAEQYFLAIDPGRNKVGMVLSDHQQGILWQGVVSRSVLKNVVEEFCGRYGRLVFILGDGTSSREVRKELESSGAIRGKVFPVNEEHSTLEGRKLYFQENPPRGWRRFIPCSLQTPPEEYDSYAARILLERFFQAREKE